VSPVKYELVFYIPVDNILHSHCCENLRSYTPLVAVQPQFYLDDSFNSGQVVMQKG
jgi:hypothetical protein